MVKTTHSPTHRHTHPLTDRPTDPPTHQPTDRPTDRLTHPPTDRPTDRPTYRPITRVSSGFSEYLGLDIQILFYKIQINAFLLQIIPFSWFLIQHNKAALQLHLRSKNQTPLLILRIISSSFEAIHDVETSRQIIWSSLSPENGISKSLWPTKEKWHAEIQ